MVALLLASAFLKWATFNDFLSKLMRNNWVHAKPWNAKSEIVVVTGGSSGIGPRVASRWVDDGVTVVRLTLRLCLPSFVSRVTAWLIEF